MARQLADVALYPQVLINVRLKAQADGTVPDWKKNAKLSEATRAVEAELGTSGRVLIRASGTEPVLRVMVEGRDPNRTKACAERLAEAAMG